MRPEGLAASRAARLLRAALWGLLTIVLLLPVSAWLALRMVAPQPGEWAVPLRIGPWRPEVGVPTLLRLATTPAFAHWLDGRRLHTRWGPVQLQWMAEDRSLHLQCAPCRVPVAALGPEALALPELTLAVFRDVERLHGLLRVGTGTAQGPMLQAWFSAGLHGGGLALQGRMASTPIADVYAVLAPQLPELQQARIGGTLALQVDAALPTGALRLSPQVEGLTVEGLGTAALAHAATSCGPPARLRRSDWLTRAVLAAEDQRFFEHPGYDLRELQAAVGANRQHGGVRRGASTLTQQLAKRLVTGDARSASRKLRELLYAVEMEQTLGKARILQLYLDNAPWGAGLCGAEAAAQHYFGRSARRLEPAQAVWLAALLHNPQAEAQRWAEGDAAALARAEWVAQGVRASARERAALMQALQAMRTRAMPAETSHRARPLVRKSEPWDQGPPGPLAYMQQGSPKQHAAAAAQHAPAASTWPGVASTAGAEHAFMGLASR